MKATEFMDRTKGLRIVKVELSNADDDYVEIYALILEDGTRIQFTPVCDEVWASLS